MFKKLSKILFSSSLAVLMGGAGLVAYSQVKGNKNTLADILPLTADIGGQVYTLDGVQRGDKIFYQVTSTDELSLLSYMISVAKDTTWADANYELTNDINLQNSSWTGIGSYDNPFTGIFNGNGYTINGLNATERAAEDAYFFDATTDDLIIPTNGYYYTVTSDSNSTKHADEYVGKTFKFEDGKGYCMTDEIPEGETEIEVVVHDAAYYGLFGYVKDAEITDVVMGRNAYVFKEDLDSTQLGTSDEPHYSGILAAYASNTKFYNIYDSSAEFNVSYSDDTGYYANVGTYNVAGDGIHYYLDNGVFTLIPNDNSAELTAYVKIYKVNTGLDTYYYLAGQANSLYSTMSVVGQTGSLSGVVGHNGTISSVGEVLIKDKKYRYEVDENTKKLTLVLKDRYILSDTATTSIVIDGTTYYYQADSDVFALFTDSTYENGEINVNQTYAKTDLGLVWGNINVNGVMHEFVWENGGDYELRILNGKEIFTIGYADSNCQMFKGQYYRLNSLQYVGIGAIDENINYSGTINVSGTTYYYIYSYTNEQLYLYPDTTLTYPSYTGRGNAKGVGSISINGTDYLFAYKRLTKDLELSSLSSYATNYPYTIENIESALQVEELNQGQIISFNAAMANSSNAGLFYAKGTDNFVTNYKLLYVKNVGLSEIDYSSNFMRAVTTLPTSYPNAQIGNYYVVNSTAGYIFEYWAVPDVETGKETIVYANALENLHSYVLSTDTSVDGEKTYYTFANGVFESVVSPTGNPVTNKYYELINAEKTLDNIIANNYEVNSVWRTKNYTVYVDINGTVTNKTVGYGTRWDTYVSTLSRAGYDITGVYYYSEGYGTSGSTSGTKIYGYSLQYEYDNYGNLSTFSYVKTNDVEIDEEKDYYTFDGSAFTIVETPDVANISNYYERVKVATYGKAFGAETLGYDYFMAAWDNGSTPQSIYVYTEWQKRPVFGKIQVSNTTDAYILTTDTAIDSSKTYYTKSGSTYTAVASPVVANIGTYYEATRRFVDGKVNNITVNAEKGLSPDANDSTKYFFQASMTDDFLQTSFVLSTGYKLNYFGVTTGTFAVTAVDYYFFDQTNYYHRYYDSTSTSIVETEMTNGGSFSSTDDISSPEEGIIYIVGTAYYIYSGSAFTQIPMVDINGNTVSFKSLTAYDTGFTVVIDITREEYEATLNITPAAGFVDDVSGKVGYTLSQDGEQIANGTVTGTTQTLTFKYDSTYSLVVNPTTEAYIIQSTDDPLTSGITTFTVTFQNGIATFAGTVQTIAANPTFTVRITYDKFKVYTEYEYETGSSYVSGANVPLLQVASLKEDDDTLYGTQSFSSGGYEFYNYSGSASIAIANNAYYSVSETSYTIYSIAATNVAGTATVVNVGTTFTEVRYILDGVEGTYYVLSDDANFDKTTGQLANVTIYTQGTETTLVGAEISGIGRSKIIVVNNVLEFNYYEITANAVGEKTVVNEVTTFNDLVNISGEVSVNGNSLTVKNDDNTATKTDYRFGEKVILIPASEKAFYTCNAIYLGYNGGIYKIADMRTSTVAENFTGNTATRYGTAAFETIGGTTYLTLTFDKVEPKNVEFYAEFIPNTASISINTSKSFVKNYDGNSDTLLNTQTITVGAGNTFGGTITYGDTSNKIISYTIPSQPNFYLVGWGIYNSSTNAVIEAYTYASSNATSGTTTLNYQTFFADNMSLFEGLFNGNSVYSIIPIVQQRTVDVTLHRSLYNDTSVGNDVNLTYYAGGQGLDISSYASHFTKTGYTPIGWESTSPAYTLSTNLISGIPYCDSITFSRTYVANTYKIFFETQSDDVISTTLNYVEGGTSTASRTISRYTVAGDDYNKYYMEITFDTWFALPNLGRAGFAFGGWTNYTSVPRDTYTVGTDNGVYQVADDLHLTPVFTANNYAVTVNANGGKFSDETTSKSVNVTYGDALLAEISEPTRPGYTFDGWYMTISGASTYEQITASTLMNKTIGSFNTISNLTSTSETYNAISVYAAWARVANYYTLDAENTYTNNYNGSEQSITFINDILANGSSVSFDSNLDQYDVEYPDQTSSWTVTYSSTENGSYSATLPGSAHVDRTNVYVTNVAESGYYKYTFTVTNNNVLVNAKMTSEKTISVEAIIHVTISPLTVELTNSYESLTATYNGTASPAIFGDGVTLSTAVNIDKLNITGYEIGNVTSGVFTAGKDVGTYNTVRFYIEFVNGYTYVSGNYGNIHQDAQNRYYFDLTQNVTIGAMDFALNPIITKVAYTGEQQIVKFTNTINVNGVGVTIEALGTMKADKVGSDQDDTVLSGTDFTMSDVTISGDALSNFNLSLSGAVTVLSDVASHNQFAVHIITKTSSGESGFSAPITADEYINLASVRVGNYEAINLANPNASNFKVVTISGESFYYTVDDTLLFQLNNNSTTLNLYSMFEVKYIEFVQTNVANNIASESKIQYNGTNYYYFATYEANANELATATALLDGLENREGVAIENNTNYYIGYTDVVPVTFNEIGGAGTSVTETKYVKLGSTLDYEVSATGYDFTGWQLVSGTNYIAITNASEVTVTLPADTDYTEATANLVCRALWGVEEPDIDTSLLTSNYALDASEGNATINFADIFTTTGATATEKLQEILNNFVDDKTISDYSIKWFEGSGDGKVEITGTRISTGEDGTNEFTLPANSTSNGAYTLGIGYQGVYGYVAFNLSFTPVELTLNESTKNFTYEYNTNRASEITVNVPASTAASKDYVLANSLNSAAKIYFTISKVADANGTPITLIANATLIEAGTYTVTLNYDSTIYTTTSAQTFDVVIAKKAYEFTDTDLKEMLGIESGEAFTKTYGENNAVLTKTSSALFNGTYTSIVPAGENAFSITFTANGITGDGTSALVGTYDIISATSGSDNYVFTVSSVDVPKLQITANMSDTLYVRLENITYYDVNGNTQATYTYDGVELTNSELVYDNVASKWLFKLKDASANVRAVWSATIYETSDTNTFDDTTIDITKYTITFSPIVNAGTYSANAFSIEAQTGASITNATIISTGSLTIAKKDVTISAMSKVFDNGYDFDSTADTLTLSGVVAGETLNATATYSEYKAGTGYGVSNIVFTGTTKDNYNLPTTYDNGAITPSNDVVTIVATNNAQTYGIVKNSIGLDLEFTGVSLGELDRELFEVTSFTIVNPQYSTGGYLKVGTYDVNVILSSDSLTNANYTASNPLVLQLTISAKTLGLSYSTITKEFDNTTNVLQTISVTGLCQGDAPITITATYATANKGTGINVNLVANGNDVTNYVLETTTLTGSITDRTHTIISLITELSGGFVDGAHASVAGGAKVGDNFTFDLGTYSNETTGYAVMTLIPNPSKTGYTFTGWSAGIASVSDDNIIGLINTALANGTNAVLTANWTKNNYQIDSVTEKAEHTSITANANANYYDTVTFSASADTGYALIVGANYEYNGSTVSIDLTDNQDGTYTFTMPAYDVTIVTSTSANEYDINYTLVRGSFDNGGAAAPSKHTYGVDTVIPNLVVDGYTFNGWIINGTGDPQKDLTLSATGYTGNISLVASWTANEYKVFFNLNGGNFSSEALAGLTLDDVSGKYYKVINYADTISLPSPSKPGYDFIRWTVGGTNLSNGTEFSYINDVTADANYVAGNYDITFSYNTETAHLSVALYRETIDEANRVAVDETLAENAGLKFAVVGGTNYVIVVTPSAGYSINEWTCEGQTATTQMAVSFTQTATVEISATANTNTITINASAADRALLEFEATVNGAQATISNYAFKAATGSDVNIIVTVSKGYSLNAPTFMNCQVVESETKGTFVVSGFTSDANVTFSVTANTYTATIVKDALNSITELTTSVQMDDEANGWSTSVTTGTTFMFTPKVTVGYSFSGVQLGNETVALGENKTNVDNSGISISITNDGEVTISGYTEAFEITLLSEVNAYTLTVTTYALDTEKKNVSSVEINVDYSESYDANTGLVIYGQSVTVTASTNETGFKFVGWFTQVTKDEGVIEYSSINRIDTDGNVLTFVMPNTNVQYFAVFEITNVELTFTVQTKTNNTIENKTTGGKVYGTNEDDEIVAIVDKQNPLYRKEVTYFAQAASGYKFIGWFIGENNVTSLEGYTVVENTEYDGFDGVVTTIKFRIMENTAIYAKFEAKPVQVVYSTSLLVNGIVTYPEIEPGHEYYTIAWGTYTYNPNLGKYEFKADEDYGNASPIRTFTGETAYIKVIPNSGYFVDAVYSFGTATFTPEQVEYNQDANYYIFAISSLNADAGTYKAEVRFYSSETLITVSFLKGENAIEAGQATVVSGAGIAIESNATSNVSVIALTGTTVTIYAYVRLGYEFELDSNSEVDFDLSGTSNGAVVVDAQGITAADRSLGYTYLTGFTISGYSGGIVNLGIKVKSSTYKVELYGTDTSSPIITGVEVEGGEVIDGLTAGQKLAITELNNIEGFTLQGFYTYADGSGYMYIDGTGNGTRVLNDNGYYWNGSAYVKSPYYTEDAYGNGTFRLYAVYVMNKTAITINAIPETLKNEEPTVTSKVVIAELNTANSWTIDSEPFYAEVIYGADVSAIAPNFANYTFAYWIVSRIHNDGETSTVYLKNAKIAELEHNDYREIVLTAVYYVRERVTSTIGGTVKISGYDYIISSDGSSSTLVSKETLVENYFSAIDDITFTATNNYGYNFVGWYDEDDNLVSEQATYVLTPEINAPMSLEARFEGQTMNMKISAPISEIGLIAKVYRNYEEISNWADFEAQVGDIIEIHVNIPDIRYHALWNNRNVNTEYSTDLRVYSYVVNKEDSVVVNEKDVIELTATFASRDFKFKLGYSLIDQVISNETSLAGRIVYAGNELPSNFETNITYGDAIILSIFMNNNYEINSITVNGLELSEHFRAFRHDVIAYANGGTITIQTSDYDYEFVQEVEINIEYKRVNWLDEFESGYSLTGRGTEESPYIIASVKDLIFMTYMINVVGDRTYASACYDLTNDIDMTGKYWAPIGTQENPFSGNFNFNVFEITNISVDVAYNGATRFDGLFGITSPNANITKTTSNIGLILGIVGGALAVIGITVGIFLAIRAKRKRDLDRLANG